MAIVLMVDDWQENLDITRMTLAPLNHQFIGLLDPTIARDAIRETCPDLIIIDLRLPKNEDGLLIGRDVRERILPDVPLIAVTAATMQYNEQMVRQAGFNEYLERPFAVQTLRKVVEKYLP